MEPIVMIWAGAAVLGLAFLPGIISLFGLGALWKTLAFAAGAVALVAGGLEQGVVAVGAWALGFVFAVCAHRAQKRALFEAQLLAAVRRQPPPA